MKIELEKFKQLLIKNWTQFIDVRQLLEYTTDLFKKEYKKPVDPCCKVKKISITRFDLVEQGFTLWIEYIVINFGTEVNLCSEFLLKNGEFFHVKTI